MKLYNKFSNKNRMYKYEFIVLKIVPAIYMLLYVIYGIICRFLLIMLTENILPPLKQMESFDEKVRLGVNIKSG